MPHSVQRSIQTIRAISILVRLGELRFGATAEDLRDDLLSRLGLSSLNVRTVKRDIEGLRAVGFNIVDDPSGAYRLIKGPETEGLDLPVSMLELLGLAMARKLVLPLAGTVAPYVGLEMLWHRLEAALPEEVREQLNEELEFQAVELDGPTGRYLEKERLISTLKRAIKEHKRLELEYHGGRDPEPRWRNLEPCGIVLYGHSLYLVAVDSDDAGTPTLLKRYKVDRILKAKTDQAKHFTPRDDVDFERYLRESYRGFGPGRNVTPIKGIEVEIDSAMAAWVEEEGLHPRQVVRPADDGKVLVSIPQAPLETLLPAVLALGDHARVLAPPELQQQLRETATRVADLYATESLPS